MSAAAIHSSKNEQVVWNQLFPKVDGNPILPLLDLAILQAHAQAAYVYRFDRVRADAQLVAFLVQYPRMLGKACRETLRPCIGIARRRCYCDPERRPTGDSPISRNSRPDDSTASYPFPYSSRGRRSDWPISASMAMRRLAPARSLY